MSNHSYIVSELVATEQVESATEKGKMLPKKGEWVQVSEIAAPSRRNAMSQLRDEDKKMERKNVQRKVRLAD